MCVLVGRFNKKVLKSKTIYYLHYSFRYRKIKRISVTLIFRISYLFIYHLKITIGISYIFILFINAVSFQPLLFVYTKGQNHATKTAIVPFNTCLIAIIASLQTRGYN